MAIDAGDCQDSKCKLLAECNRVYKGSHPPCSDIAEAQKTPTNTGSLKLPTLEEYQKEVQSRVWRKRTLYVHTESFRDINLALAQWNKRKDAVENIV